MGMSCLNLGRLKDRRLRTAVFVVICGPLLATIRLAVAQTSNPRTADFRQKRVALIIHAADQVGNPVVPDLVKDVVAMEHGNNLQVVDGPKSAGRKQIAVLIDSNFHQRKVLALEQQTAVELLSGFEREKARALVIRYGAEIHSSGELTDDLGGLKNFTDSLRVETDKRNETVLLYDAMKRAFEKLNDGPGTKAVVVFAEGNDHGSSIAWRSLARLAQRGHIACYVVLFADHSFYGREVRHYGYYLVELAPKTGGRLWEVGDNPRKVHETVKQATAQLDSQGLIEVLVPDVRTNRFHSIKVTSTGHRLSAQTGYFDDGMQ
jgi:VWFA-related protein